MKKLPRRKIFGYEETSVTIFILYTLSIILFLTGIVMWNSGEEIMLGGTRSGFIFSIILSLISVVLVPIFGSKSLSMTLFFFAFGTVWFSLKISRNKALHNKKINKDT